jgi:hypothetical protein
MVGEIVNNFEGDLVIVVVIVGSFVLVFIAGVFFNAAERNIFLEVVTEAPSGGVNDLKFKNLLILSDVVG